MKSLLFGKIIEGDALRVLRTFPANSVDLIVTSPPYADARGNAPKPHEYVDWFLPIANELHRVLKPSGSFFLNIKERVENGQRHPYVLRLVLAMMRDVVIERGMASRVVREEFALPAFGGFSFSPKHRFGQFPGRWLWTEEYIWHKAACHPGKWPNRFRDAWEHIYQFNRQREFYMNQEAVMEPVGDWARKRLPKMRGNDLKRKESDSGSKFGKRIANWVGRDKVYPSNVLYMSSVSYDVGSAAAFPIGLPEFFVKAFCPPKGIVLDPFAGSGSTRIAAEQNGRRFVGIDILGEPKRKPHHRRSSK